MKKTIRAANSSLFVHRPLPISPFPLAIQGEQVPHFGYCQSYVPRFGHCRSDRTRSLAHYSSQSRTQLSLLSLRHPLRHTHTHTHIFQQRAYYSSAVCFTCVCMVHVVRAWRVSQNSCFHTNAIFVVMWSTVLRTVHHTLNADTGEIPPVTRPCGRDYCCRAAAGAALSTPNDVVVVLKSRSPEVPKSRSLEAVLLPTMHVYNKRAIQFSSLAERWIPSCDLGTRVVRHVELLMFVYFAFLT